MIWTPTAGLKDFAGNPLATTAVTESGGRRHRLLTLQRSDKLVAAALV